MGGGTCRNVVELYGRRYNNAPMSSLPLLGSGSGASEPVTGGGVRELLLLLPVSGWGADSAEMLLRYLVEYSFRTFSASGTDTRCVVGGRSVVGNVGAREKKLSAYGTLAAEGLTADLG